MTFINNSPKIVLQYLQIALIFQNLPIEALVVPCGLPFATLNYKLGEVQPINFWLIFMNNI